jgi:alpha-tubulin suppressor-like RCC1 family protein
MISSKTIIDKANAKITAGLTEEEVQQLSVIDDSITKSKLVVDTFGNLPNVADNKGRLVYVSGENLYYFSDGVEWLSDFSSVLQIISAIYAWGLGTNAQLGDDTAINRSSPVTVVGGITDWSAIAGSQYHSLGLTNAGVIYAWGRGSSGQLGDGTVINKSSPVTVVGGITNWSAISVSRNANLGLTSTGLIYVWGLNNSGQLGDNTILNKSSPVTIVGGITNWSAIAAGGNHNLGLRDNGVLYVWGLNNSGQLGNNTAINRSSPVTVVGGITNWSQISVGDDHSLGLTSTGLIYAWGLNLNGQLGDNTILNRSSPVTIVGGITNWSAIAAGGAHNLGLRDNGVLYAWGFGGYGQLGDNAVIRRSSPVTVVGGITNWSAIAAGGGGHSLGVRADGTAWAWGTNANGRLGDDTLVARSSPVTVVGGITNWSAISAGFSHSLAFTAPQSKGFNEP